MVVDVCGGGCDTNEYNPYMVPSLCIVYSMEDSIVSDFGRRYQFITLLFFFSWNGINEMDSASP